MNCGGGFLKIVCVSLMIVMQTSEAGPALMKQAAGVSCSLHELTVLVKSLVEASLMGFDKANGKHLGTWTPGFPELQVQKDSSFNGSKVECSLFFMALGLEEILLDQRNNLNPKDFPFHEKLRETIARVKMLAACVKEILGDECSPKPSPPKMPKHTFDRKQWSHTLLVTARDYLEWLELKTEVKDSTVEQKNKIKRKIHRATIKVMNIRKREYVQAAYQNNLEGSGYLV